MREYSYTLHSWPRDKGGNPIFTCTEQAIFFAHLCSDEEGESDRLALLRKASYVAIAEQRSKREPNYQRMMDLAFKAQMYRECLEEIQRINDSKYDLKNGG